MTGRLIFLDSDPVLVFYRSFSHAAHNLFHVGASIPRQKTSPVSFGSHRELCQKENNEISKRR